MHLLFLGFVCTTRTVIFDWINRTKNPFYSVIKKYMYRTIILFKLDWCKIIDAEFGWISDNYLVCCRLMK